MLLLANTRPPKGIRPSPKTLVSLFQQCTMKFAKHAVKNLPGRRGKRKIDARTLRSVGLQIYKMINLGSNVIVYKLKHCVLHFEVNMMTF